MGVSMKEDTLSWIRRPTSKLKSAVAKGRRSGSSTKVDGWR